MLRLTIDRAALIKMIQKEGDTAMRIASDCGVKATSMPASIKLFQESQNMWFEPGCSEHKFLRRLNADRIDESDVVTIEA